MEDRTNRGNPPEIILTTTHVPLIVQDCDCTKKSAKAYTHTKCIGPNNAILMTTWLRDFTVSSARETVVGQPVLITTGGGPSSVSAQTQTDDCVTMNEKGTASEVREDSGTSSASPGYCTCENQEDDSADDSCGS